MVRKEFESAGCGGPFLSDGGLVGSSGVSRTNEDGVCAWDWLSLGGTEDQLGDVSRLRLIKAVKSKRGGRAARGIDG